MKRTAVVILTWNRLKNLKNTLKAFKKYHVKFKDENIIIVDNGSTDGTQEFLKTTKYDLVLNKENTGAQMGKWIGWNRARKRKFDFIIFIEDDHTCYRTLPIPSLESYLDRYDGVGIIRLNDKPYLKRHQISRMPLKWGRVDKLKDEFVIKRCNYHFTSNPSIFRTSLAVDLQGCVYPKLKPRSKKLNIEVLSKKLGFDEYKGTDKYDNAIERLKMDFGVTEKEYMRLYMLKYYMTAQLVPECFKTKIKKRVIEWKN